MDSKNIMKWVNRLRVKTSHTQYTNGEISYGEYKDRLFDVVNAIRGVTYLPYLSRAKFDDAWQYRILAHEKWDCARNEIFNVVIGWW